MGLTISRRTNNKLDLSTKEYTVSYITASYDVMNIAVGGLDEYRVPLGASGLTEISHFFPGEIKKDSKYIGAFDLLNNKNYIFITKDKQYHNNALEKWKIVYPTVFPEIKMALMQAVLYSLCLNKQ